MRKKKIRRADKSGTTSVNSKYAKKNRLQRKGVFSSRSPFTTDKDGVE